MPERLNGTMSVVYEGASFEGFDTLPRGKRKVLCESGTTSTQNSKHFAADKSRQLRSEWSTARVQHSNDDEVET